MKAAVLQEPFPRRVDRPHAAPARCRTGADAHRAVRPVHSEIDLWIGKAPDELGAAIGHEVAGIIEQTGPRGRVAAGGRPRCRLQ